ncbi:helix-turn-helix domain-containing protein [Streptomyces sp. SID3343]|uniref:helix-turn-helix domain-containing protein n=1 Tax=Streptomyces sp. SID3343 TaxID=2690260 RepID=UPI0013713A39|nr:helix-turn-helix domain-containing protein [Streptomyces sp. SID3343]
MVAETSQILDRGLKVLALLADAPEGMSVPDIATRLGVNRTVVYRILATLGQHGLIRRDVNGRTRLGLGALQLARRAQPLVRDAAVPCLRRLAEETGATAHLTIVDGMEALVVAVAEPTWTDYHVAYRVGSRHALDAGAAGLAILAARRTIAGLDAATTYVYAPGDGRHTVPGIAAAVPHLAAVESSVGIVSLGNLDTEHVGARVAEAAAELSEELGGVHVSAA